MKKGNLTAGDIVFHTMLSISTGSYKAVFIKILDGDSMNPIYEFTCNTTLCSKIVKILVPQNSDEVFTRTASINTKMSKECNIVLVTDGGIPNMKNLIRRISNLGKTFAAGYDEVIIKTIIDGNRYDMDGGRLLNHIMINEPHTLGKKPTFVKVDYRVDRDFVNKKFKLLITIDVKVEEN